MSRGSLLPVLLALLGSAAGAAPRPELAREPTFNYRLVGELPANWTRRGTERVWVFSIDGIPHAYVHFVRERLETPVDAESQVAKRVEHYRFPGAGKQATSRTGRTEWGGQPAATYFHEAALDGVLCRRRVTALCAGKVWYELIETVYGEKTAELDDCRRGLRLFHRGFRLIAAPLTKEQRLDREERSLADPELEYRLLKPEGFVREDVDAAVSPNCVLALRAKGPQPRWTVLVRLFEYGVRTDFDAAAWTGSHFAAFASDYQGAARQPLEPTPAVAGAARVHAERFSGTRDGLHIDTRLLFAQAASGRVFALQVRSTGGAGATFAGALDRLLATFSVAP